MPNRESLAWKRLNPIFKRFNLDAQRVECSLGLGVPDINIVSGWIELKNIKEYPKRESTPIRVAHFTPEQKTWIKRRKRKGGNVWLILAIARDWFLLDGLEAVNFLGKTTKEELISHSLVFSKDPQDLILYLVNKRNNNENKF